MRRLTGFPRLCPKVGDFGLAKILGDDAPIERTVSGAMLGTKQYMSPEQVARRSDGGRSVHGRPCPRCDSL